MVEGCGGGRAGDRCNVCQGSQSEKEQIRGIKDSGDRGVTQHGVKERVEALSQNISLKFYT